MKGENLSLELEKTLKYFEHIVSLNYWDYMPGPGPGLINTIEENAQFF